ncbi:Spy/CpxP family protein refolding chaperone [Aerosakkonemataceae cyanobacterium BLCC-F154]|uniref:Spy/CpxP family protein refolding chaperone n=1 Tax=Floridaenema fluviatile BLCC-F154 TaxID=3153640 RepID=A0ABV4Y953_9CYAN
MKLFLLSTTLILLPITTSIALSKPPLASIAQVPPNPVSAPPAPPWTQAVNLSAEQKERIAAIHKQAKQEVDKLHQELFAADNQMRSLLESNASIEQLRQQYQQIQQLRQQLANTHFEAMLAERQVLTNEQLTQVLRILRQQRSTNNSQK